MTKPRKWLGLTWVGWINMLVCQWLGLRLALFISSDDPTVAPEWRNVIMGIGISAQWPLVGWFNGKRHCGGPMLWSFERRLNTWDGTYWSWSDKPNIHKWYPA